jgi:hemerythrin-like domain-containing protein
LNEEKKISQIMKRHHYLIEGELNRFIKYQNKPNVFPTLFNKFKWEIEKHFFLEEKAIFTFIESENQDIYEISKGLIDAHRELLKNLKEIEDRMKNKKESDLLKFKELLINHRDFEEKSFYPKLDEELDDCKKSQIIDRIELPL